MAVVNPGFMGGDGKRIWERQPGESELAYREFLVYRDMGLNRRVSDMPPRKTAFGRKLVGGENFSKKWGWSERARSWDNHLQAEKDKHCVKQAVKWGERREEQREELFGLAEALRVRAREMLSCVVIQAKTTGLGKAVLVEKRDEAGRVIMAVVKGAHGKAMFKDGHVVMEPVMIPVMEAVGWTQKDIPLFARCAAELAGLAMGGYGGVAAIVRGEEKSDVKTLRMYLDGPDDERIEDSELARGDDESAEGAQAAEAV